MRQHGEAGDPTPETPNVSPGSGVAGFGVEFWHPIDFTQNNFQLKDTLTLSRGRHSLKAGGELRLGRDGATLNHWKRPGCAFQNVLDFIDDEPFRRTARSIPPPADERLRQVPVERIVAHTTVPIRLDRLRILSEQLDRLVAHVNVAGRAIHA